MLRVDLKASRDDLLDDTGSFSVEEQLKATARALNRAARGAITDGSKKIRERFKQLKKRDVDAAFSIKPATPDQGGLRAVVTVSGRPLSLARFLAGQITERGKGGVWVNVKGQRKFIPHVWAQALKSKSGDDYIVLMSRKGKDRYPVQVLRTIDIPGAFGIAEVIEYVEQQSGVRFETELARNLKFMEGNR